jgi:hypothetical protein
MQPVDARLREDLATIAEDAGALSLSPERLVAKVRRRRRRSVIGTAVGTVAVVIGILVVIGPLRPDSNGGLRPAAPAVSPGALSYPRPFVCGEELMLGPDASTTRAGLTMTLSQSRKVSDGIGPDLAVTFTADRPLHVQGSPPKLFEVLYLKDGVIVGGGPMLNQPGDMTPQGMDLIGSGFDVGPGSPNTQYPGRRDTVCPGLAWPQVWSEPQQYEVVLVQGRVLPGPDSAPDQLLLDIPTLGYWPLLVSHARLET